MDYKYHDPQTNRALNLFRSVMNKFSEGTEEYRRAQKGFRFVANRVRQNEKLEKVDNNLILS